MSISHIAHQNRVLGGRDRFGHRSPGLVQALHRLVLVHQPRRVAHLDAERRLFADRTHHAMVRFFDSASVCRQHIAPAAVDLVVAQIAEPARPVHLDRQQVAAHRRVCLAEIDARLLATLDLCQHVDNEFLVIERADRLQHPALLVPPQRVRGLKASLQAHEVSQRGHHPVLRHLGDMSHFGLALAPGAAICLPGIVHSFIGFVFVLIRREIIFVRYVWGHSCFAFH